MPNPAPNASEEQHAVTEQQRSSYAPLSWRNWRAKREGAPSLAMIELNLFSDAWFVAEARDHGPYSILNAIAHTTQAGGLYEWKPALVLRIENFLPGDRPDMSVTFDDHYHGGWFPDEVAALIALILGARISAGPVNREFEPDGDPLGRPRAHSAGRLPVLPPRTEAPQIPSLLGQRDLRHLGLINTLPDLSPEAAIALIKSARLYQQALWVSDTSPEISWLLFVSALEAAAGFWDALRMPPAERLVRSYPGLVRILDEASHPGLIDQVAEELHRLIASTGKFVGFCIEFAPDPPAERPELSRFDFSRRNYRVAIEKVYHYRSRALHGGTPFPKPMCVPPRSYDASGVVEERPTGLAAATLGATWLAEDLPMYLQLFVHITRGALLKWWNSLAPQDGSP
jgi:hypothetical protein